MNVLETLNDELKNKHWTKEEKARFLYLRSCELFSYDNRYHFCGYFENPKERREAIRNRKINLEDVTDFTVICTTHIKEVYKELLRELADIDGEVEWVIKDVGHPWIEFNDGIRRIKADSTNGSDISRVKMKLNTTDYGPAKIEINEDYEKYLKEIDKKIGYIKQNYYSTTINTQVTEMYKEYKKVHHGLNTASYTNLLYYEIYTIMRYLEQYKKFPNFSDVEYALSYLGENFLEENAFDFTKATSLFAIDGEENWTFYNIYPLTLGKDTIYYLLTNEGKENNFYEIHREDALTYVRKLEGINKGRFFYND